MVTGPGFLPAGRVTLRLLRGPTRPPVSKRFLQHATIPPSGIPDFAFAFDIDGVLVRGSKALPKASETLNNLRANRIPFLLLTNGGGYHEEKRANFLSEELQTQIDTSMILQSHTPFQDVQHLKDKTVLVVGGEHGNCRDVAHQYGFKDVLTPSDIFSHYPSIWPFSKPLSAYHSKSSHGLPLPKPIHPVTPNNSLKIDAVFVYNDPRDWGLDASLILDCLLSKEGILGTISDKNGRSDLPNHGYLQDGQPHVYFSNPDLWFASEFALPRLGQGGFRAALEGLWRTVSSDANLQGHFTVMGKPSQDTYEFAERRLRGIQKKLSGSAPAPDMRRVYMVGDNPASDIQGANEYKSPFNSLWHSILVQTGVWDGLKDPDPEPTIIVEDVHDAVQWALRHAGYEGEATK